MTLSITALYAGILAPDRGCAGDQRDGAPREVEGAARRRRQSDDAAHDPPARNAVEYIPLALVLMAIYEINGGSHTLLHIAGIVLIVGRMLQTWNMWSTPMAGFGRITGQSSTWLTIVALAGLNLWKLT